MSVMAKFDQLSGLIRITLFPDPFTHKKQLKSISPELFFFKYIVDDFKNKIKKGLPFAYNTFRCCLWEVICANHNTTINWQGQLRVRFIALF